MNELLDTSARGVAEGVRELARAVCRALDDEAPLEVETGSDDPVLLAAARVLGADVLAPSTLSARAATEPEVALLVGAVRAFPPQEGSPTSQWMYWGARVALGETRGSADEPDPGPVADVPWPRLAHQFAGLAALSTVVPSALTTAAARRVEDLSRGFVRAVRRGDWPQAAGTGRWLAAVDGVPSSLGLDAGLEFVEMMGNADARVALDVRVARILRRRRAR